MVKKIESIAKLIDITLLGEYHETLVKDILDVEFKKVADKIGEVPTKVGTGDDEQTVTDLVDFVDKSVLLANKVNNTLDKRVEANETAINTTLPAYIDAAAAKAVVDVVGGASDSKDTLEKLEEWINAHNLDAKGIQDAIKALQGTDGSTQTKETASIPGVKLYIDSIVGGKDVDAGTPEGEVLLTATPEGNKVIVASTEALQTAVANANSAVQGISEGASVENYVELTVSGTTVKIDDSALSTKIGAMYADMQGETTETVASVETKVGYLTLATSDDITGIFTPKTA